MSENIHLLYSNDILFYSNIHNYFYDSEKGMVWFTDKEGYKHEVRGNWHYWEDK